MAGATTVGDYLLRRLWDVGVRDIFGVPGDYVLGFFDQICRSKVRLISNCNELNAGYAADGYARINGVGAVVTTFGVGSLSQVNALAGARAEHVPVVSICGTPTTEQIAAKELKHHVCGGDYDMSLRVFEQVAIAAVRLTDAASAPTQIDEALATCLTDRGPVYIELPGDVAKQATAEPGPWVLSHPSSNPAALREAADEAFALLRKGDHPVVLGDVLVQRYGVQPQFERLLEHSGYPFAVLQQGKTLLSEQHPQFLGVYSGAASRPYVREYVEEADIILATGTMLVDFNLGGFTANLRPERMIVADPDGVSIRHHCYSKVLLRDFLKELSDRFAAVGRSECPIRSAREELSRPISPEAGRTLTSERFFERLGCFFPEAGIVVAESGNSLSSSAELLMPEGATFLSQTCYGSIGYAVGCALGANIAGRGRPCTLVIGDGSLQLTAQELSVMIRYGLDIVVFVLNNEGYGVERLIHDGLYNDIAAWHYHKLPDAFGGGWGCEVRTEGELEEALAKARGRRGLSLIEVHLGRTDLPEHLRQMCEAAAKADKLG